jgi:hypothetical protein
MSPSIGLNDNVCLNQALNCLFNTVKDTGARTPENCSAKGLENHRDVHE